MSGRILAKRNSSTVEQVVFNPSHLLLSTTMTSVLSITGVFNKALIPNAAALLLIDNYQAATYMMKISNLTNVVYYFSAQVTEKSRTLKTK